jgi:DNA-binding MarR family transcriptional regulator
VRPRKPGRLQALLLAELAAGPQSRRQLADATCSVESHVCTSLRSLVRRGLVLRSGPPRRVMWSLAERAA